MTQPNIILITTDQQRYDSIRLHGNAFMQTPNLDRLGTEGISFDRAYCPNTVCTPSRVSMMTGLHLSRHGAYNIGTYASDYAPFLSTVLRKEGYVTHHIGKAHWHPWCVKDSPEWLWNPDTAAFSDPIADFAGFETAELSIGHVTYGITAHYADWVRKKGVDPSAFGVSKLFEHDMNNTGDWDLPTKLHSGTWLAERAVSFLEAQQNNAAPFFLNLGFQDPHHPHILPRDFTDRVDPNAVPYPEFSPEAEENLPEHIPLFRNDGIQGSRFTGRFELAGQGSTPWEAYFQNEEKGRATRAYYYSMVQLIDHQLGTILDALDTLGMTDNTLVIFTTDHGEMLGDHFIGQKGPLCYEGVTHIPLLMRYPNGFAPTRIENCVSLVDIAPTVLDFAGVDDPFSRDGISLAPTLCNGTPLQRPGVRIEYKEDPDTIRYKGWVTPQWKMAVYTGETFGELYDLTNDPGEHRNLFDDPDYSNVKARLLVDMLQDMERSEPVSPRPCRC